MQIIYIATLNWNFLTQRSHHLALGLAKSGFSVLYVEPGLKFWRRWLEIPLRPWRIFIPYLKPLSKNFWILRCDFRLPMWPFDRISWCRDLIIRLNQTILWRHILKAAVFLRFKEVTIIHDNIYSCPVKQIAKSKKGRLRNFVKKLVLDCVDAYDKFPWVDARFVQKLERESVTNADLILVSAQELKKRPVLRDNKKTHYLPNGVDFKLFSQPVNCVPEPLQKLKKSGYKIFGYIGAIADWLDAKIFENILNASENFVVCIIGQFLEKNQAIRNEIQKLKKQFSERLLLLSSKPYQELPSFIHNFDVGLIPFKVNDLTKYVLPIKLFEYLACGKSVISTYWDEIGRFREVVNFVSENHPISETINQALIDLTSETAYRRRLEIAKEYSWDSIIRKLVKILSEES